MKLRAAAFAALLCCPVLGAQEARYIDLTAVEQRTQLRYPPASDRVPNGVRSGARNAEGTRAVACGGSSSWMEGEGADSRDPHALGVYLTHRTATQIDPSQPFQVELKVVNTGKAPIAIPVSPQLSDLQPADDSVRFHYLSMALTVSVVEDPRSSAYVELYGAPRHEQTVVTLQPGEWVRITANVKLLALPTTADTARLIGGFYLRSNTFFPHPGGCFTETQDLYPNVTRTVPLEVFWLGTTATP